MWPFTKPEPEEIDYRPPSAAALAISESMREEPLRWQIGAKRMYLLHDSNVLVDAENYSILQPWIGDEPEANTEVIEKAVNDWVAARLACPPPAPATPNPPTPAKGE